MGEPFNQQHIKVKNSLFKAIQEKLAWQSADF